ncbi:unnamed protein product, partial [Adineta steineri]
EVDVWPEGSTSSIRSLTTLLLLPPQLPGVAVASNGDIYASIFVLLADRVDKWSLGATSSSAVISYSLFNSIGACQSLFVSTNSYIYCSSSGDNTVYKNALSSSATSSTTAAGTGSCGSTSNKLCSPLGIFVDSSLKLYVADSGNNRIQVFASGSSTATTVSITGTSSLNTPSGVVLDGSGYLFIVDQGNNRIIGQGPNGFRCVVGCTGSSGSASDQLSSPQT